MAGFSSLLQLASAGDSHSRFSSTPTTSTSMTSNSSSSTSSLPSSPLPTYSSSRPPKELRAEKGKQKGEIRGIERYRIMKLVLKGDFPEGNCVETPKRHLAGQKYWKKEAQVPAEVLASSTYELDLQVVAPKGQLIEQCQKCRQESGKSSFVLVCCEGACSTEEGLCIPLICPCLPTHQNKQATFDLRVNLVNRLTREIEFNATLPISFRTGKKKRSDSLSPSPSPSSSSKSISPPLKTPKLKKSSTASSSSSLGFLQRKENNSIVISPHPKENQLFSSSSFANNNGPATSGLGNWFSNTASSIEFHWNAQPTHLMRQQQQQLQQQQQQLAQFNSQAAANGLLYQQEYETPLGQITFKTAPSNHPSHISQPTTAVKPSPFFYEPSNDYWLTDWLNEAVAEGGIASAQHYHRAAVAAQEGANAAVAAAVAAAASHGDSNGHESGNHSHPHNLPMKSQHLESIHPYPYSFVGSNNNQQVEFEELFPNQAAVQATFNNFMAPAGSATPFYSHTY